MSRGFSFYDDLRTSPTASFRPVQESEPSEGRALHVASDPDRLGASDVTLCHVPIFLRYSMYNSENNQFQDVSSLSYGGTAGALLAMHHFNNGDGSIIEELEGIDQSCNIRFTTEVVDTQSSPIVAVKNLASKITGRQKTDIEEPQACALMGAAWYTVSQSMATVAGVYDLFQVSPSSSSMSLDSMSQFPLFSRTHPSDEAKGRLSVEYFDKVLGIKHFGILFVNNEMGISLQKTVMKEVEKRNLITKSVAFDENADRASLRSSLLQLKETGFNYFLGMFFPLKYEYVLGVAAEVGVAGPGKFWLGTGHLADAFALQNTTVEPDSYEALGSIGLGILHDDGGPGLPKYENFITQWKNIQHDQNALDYINSKQPRPPEGTNMSFARKGDYFGIRPNHYVQFSYDAVAGMGIAACRASKQSKLPDNYFTGKEHHNMFVSHPFIGTTGNVSFANNSFSRDGLSVYSFVSEIHEIERSSSDGSILSGRTDVFFDTSQRKWKSWPGSQSYVYPGGSSTPPAELPDYSEDMNSLTSPIRVVCLLLAAIVMAMSIGLASFVFVKRQKAVVRASQPPFLYMLCIGTLVLASAIIPITIDDSLSDDAGCSIACMAKMWLMSIGFTITFSALFSKTWRVNKLVKRARGFQRVTVTVADVAVPFLVLFLSNVLILSLWTKLAPLEWERKPREYDSFGRVTDSVGGCYSDGWLPYGVALFLVNGVALLLAIGEAYKAREITTEYSESKCIGMAVLCIFQALFFGIPLLFIAKEWPVAQVFVMSAVIFIICMAVLLLIFVPKIRQIKTIVRFPSLSLLQSAVRSSTADLNRKRSSLVTSQTTSFMMGQRGDSAMDSAVDRGSDAIALEEEIWNTTHLDERQKLQLDLRQAKDHVLRIERQIEEMEWLKSDVENDAGVRRDSPAPTGGGATPGRATAA